MKTSQRCEEHYLSDAYIIHYPFIKPLLSASPVLSSKNTKIKPGAQPFPLINISSTRMKGLLLPQAGHNIAFHRSSVFVSYFINKC